MRQTVDTTIHYKSEPFTLIVRLADHQPVLRVVGLPPVALGEGLDLILFAPDELAWGSVFLLFLLLELEGLSQRHVFVKLAHIDGQYFVVLVIALFDLWVLHGAVLHHHEALLDLWQHLH